MDKLISIGFITGPFGLKGELKIISDENHLDKIFKIGNALYIDNNKYIIKTYRLQKNHHLVSFDGFEDINKIENLIKKNVYINKEDLSLENNEYLYIELYDLDIIDNNEIIGKVEEILFNKTTTFIKSGNLIIPMIPKYFDKVDLKNKKVYVKDTKELIL